MRNPKRNDRSQPLRLGHARFQKRQRVDIVQARRGLKPCGHLLPQPLLHILIQGQKQNQPAKGRKRGVHTCPEQIRQQMPQLDVAAEGQLRAAAAFPSTGFLQETRQDAIALGNRCCWWVVDLGSVTSRRKGAALLFDDRVVNFMGFCFTI